MRIFFKYYTRAVAAETQASKGALTDGRETLKSIMEIVCDEEIIETSRNR